MSEGRGEGEERKLDGRGGSFPQGTALEGVYALKSAEIVNSCHLCEESPVPPILLS